MTAFKHHRSWIHSLIGIGINLVLFVIKLVTGLTIQSIALVNDGFNHLSDTGTSFVMLFGFLYGERQADDNHPHGHGRAEYIATLIIGMLILLLSFQLCINAFNGLMNNQVPMIQPWVYVVLAGSMVTKLIMYIYYTRLHAQTRSLPYKAVAVDAINDVLITGFVGLGTFFSSSSWRWDAIAGLLIAGFIFVQGFRILYEAFQTLMGRREDDVMLTTIGNAILKYPGVAHIHSLSYHDYGPLHRVITVHVEVPNTLSLTESHTLIDGLEMTLEKQFPIELVIHVDPITQDKAIIEQPFHNIQTILHGLFPYVSIEAFRMVNTPHHPEVIFKVNGLKGSERNLHRQKMMIKNAIYQQYPMYRVYLE